MTILFHSTFVNSHMKGVTIRNAELTGNNFDGADMSKSQWVQDTVSSNNSFVGADLSNSFWYDVYFQESKQPSNFTDANLSGISVTAQGVSSGPHELTEAEMPSLKAILCRTAFSEGYSNRDSKK